MDMDLETIKDKAAGSWLLGAPLIAQGSCGLSEKLLGA